jgi:hypothetical protein
MKGGSPGAAGMGPTQTLPWRRLSGYSERPMQRTTSATEPL